MKKKEVINTMTVFAAKQVLDYLASYGITRKLFELCDDDLSVYLMLKAYERYPEDIPLEEFMNIADKPVFMRLLGKDDRVIFEKLAESQAEIQLAQAA